MSKGDAERSPVVTAEGLSRTYTRGALPVKALEGVSIRLVAGEMLGVSGPSGCGKSTLLNLIGLCDRPTSGSVEIAGEAVDFANESRLAVLRRSRLGYVFQYFNLLPTLSALENVALSLMLNGAGYDDARARSEAALRGIGLGDRLAHMPGELSGGQMQRVAVARALVHEPKLVLADEPTGNLDSAAGEEVLGLLREAADRGTAVVLVSHNGAALARCDRVVELRDGRVSA